MSVLINGSRKNQPTNHKKKNHTVIGVGWIIAQFRVQFKLLFITLTTVTLLNGTGQALSDCRDRSSWDQGQQNGQNWQEETTCLNCWTKTSCLNGKKKEIFIYIVTSFSNRCNLLVCLWRKVHPSQTLLSQSKECLGHVQWTSGPRSLLSTASLPSSTNYQFATPMSRSSVDGIRNTRDICVLPPIKSSGGRVNIQSSHVDVCAAAHFSGSLLGQQVKLLIDMSPWWPSRWCGFVVGEGADVVTVDGTTQMSCMRWLSLPCVSGMSRPLIKL